MGEGVRDIPAGRSRSGCLRTRSKGACIVKKLEEAGGPKKKPSADDTEIDTDTIILAGLERGLTITDIRSMQIGQIVDFCIAFNDRQKKAEKKAKYEEKHGTRRRATQQDINAFFG